MPGERAVTIAAALALLSAPRAVAAAGMLVSEARSVHFEVLTDAPLEAARRAALDLERFRVALGAATGLPAPTTVTRVIALGDRRLFEDVVPRHAGRPQEVDGFYLTGGSTPTLVVRSDVVSGPARETLFHEYAHIFFNARLPAQPVWVSEGLADLYSTLDERDGAIHLGRPPADHLRVLREQPLVPVPTLLQTGYSSPAYQRADGRPMLYAESWALVHALVLERGRGSLAGLLAFLGDISSGQVDVVAFTNRFGTGLSGDTGPLLVYGLGAGRPSITMPAPAHVHTRVEAGAARPAQAAVAVAALLLSAGRSAEAKTQLREAVLLDPAHAPTHEALAHVALHDRDFSAARAHAARALELEPQGPAAHLRHAQSLVRQAAARGDALTAGEEDEAVRALERAVAAGSRDPDACELLARLRPQPLAHRVRLLEEALAGHPGRADLGLVLADLHLMWSDYPSAIRALVRARAEARDDTLAFLSDHALARVRALARGKVEIRGRLVAVDCRPGGSLEFQVLEGNRRLRLVAPSPTGVFLYKPSGERLEKTLTCGPQHVSVYGWYRMGSPSREEDGTLLSLTFEGG